MPTRYVRAADVDAAWKQYRHLSFSERFAKVYGVPPELVREMSVDREADSDVVVYEYQREKEHHA